MEIVKNGYNGKCCEGFTLPFNPEEFKKHNEAVDRGEDFIIKDDGQVFRTFNDNEREKIRNMIIYLGTTNVDPQRLYQTLNERYNYARNQPEDTLFTLEDLNRLNQKTWDSLVDGEIVVNLYTCKHFDTVKRICTNYEDRPMMCKSFGKGCSYEGCCMNNKVEKSQKEVDEYFSNNDVPYEEAEKYRNKKKKELGFI